MNYDEIRESPGAYSAECRYHKEPHCSILRHFINSEFINGSLYLYHKGIELGPILDNFLCLTIQNIYVNTTLIARKFLKVYKGLEHRGAVYNLLAEDWSEWIDENVPYGWPQPGRNYLIEIKYKFYPSFELADKKKNLETLKRFYPCVRKWE